MRSVAVEMRRFLARRIVRGTVVLAALIIVVSIGIMTARGHEARQFGRVTVPGVTIERPDGTTIEKPGETFVREENDTRPRVGSQLSDALEGTGLAMMFVAFALGASLVGAEFNGASLSTQLLFEPRRWRLHLAKAIAVAAVVACVSLAVSLLVTVALLVGSEVNGVVRGLDSSFWSHRFSESLRIAAAVGAAGLMAYTVALVGRRTSAGILVFILQVPMLGLISPERGPFRWVSLYAPIRGLVAITADPAHNGNADPGDIRTLAGGVVLTCIWVIALAAVSGGIFSRAEVR